jgi:hypothetical protein
MIEAHEEDLKTYLYQELEQGEIYNIADQEFVNKLVLKLTKGAEGMYAFSSSSQLRYGYPPDSRPRMY